MITIEIERAKEIMSSYGVIGVRLDHAPVWLERVHEDTGLVEIKYLENERRLEVQAAVLSEDAMAVYEGPS